MLAGNVPVRKALSAVNKKVMPDELKNPAVMSDREFIAEWECIDCDSEYTSRSDALAVELQNRDLDF